MIKSFSCRPLIFFRLHHHRNIAPTKADIGMMTLSFGDFCHLLNKRKRFAKIAKSEGPLDAPGLVADFPLWNVEMKVLGLLQRESVTPPLQGVHVFSQRAYRSYAVSFARCSPQSPRPGFGEKDL